MAGTNLDGYIAFTEDEGNKVDQQGLLTRDRFNVQYPWVPFADTIDGAIKKVMMSSQGNPEAATSPTTWYVLHIELTAEKVLESFTNQLLHKCKSRGVPGWRLYADVELGVGNSFEWLMITVGPYEGPIGIAARAEKAWGKKDWEQN